MAKEKREPTTIVAVRNKKGELFSAPIYNGGDERILTHIACWLRGERIRGDVGGGGSAAPADSIAQAIEIVSRNKDGFYSLSPTYQKKEVPYRMDDFGTSTQLAAKLHDASPEKMLNVAYGAILWSKKDNPYSSVADRSGKLALVLQLNRLCSGELAEHIQFDNKKENGKSLPILLVDQKSGSIILQKPDGGVTNGSIEIFSKGESTGEEIARMLSILHSPDIQKIENWVDESMEAITRSSDFTPTPEDVKKAITKAVIPEDEKYDPMLIEAIYGCNDNLRINTVSIPPSKITIDDVIDATPVVLYLTARNLMSGKKSTPEEKRVTHDLTSSAKSIIAVAEKKGWIDRRSETQWDWSRKIFDEVVNVSKKRKRALGRAPENDAQAKIEAHLKYRWPKISGLKVSLQNTPGTSSEKIAKVEWEDGPAPFQVAQVLEQYVGPRNAYAMGTTRPVEGYRLERKIVDPEIKNLIEDVEEEYGEQVANRYADLLDCSSHPIGEKAWLEEEIENPVKISQQDEETSSPEEQEAVSSKPKLR